MKRIFIVGCPRSGTTLLQSMLAAHPDLISFTESHFFTRGFIHLRPKNIFYLPRNNIEIQLLTFLRENNIDVELPNILSSSKIKSAGYWRNLFIKLLDTHASHSLYKGWIEKTPAHLHHIRFISRQTNRVSFIHMFRNGQDVTSSIYDVSNRYPHIWGRRTIEECANRWNRDIKKSLRWIKKENHMGIRYEELITEPESILKQLIYFLKLEWSDSVLNHQHAAKEVVTREEPWKSGNLNKLTASSRYNKLNNEQKFYLEKNLNSYLYTSTPSWL